MTQNNIYKQTEIGLIPIDWEVRKLGEIAKIFDGTHTTPTYVEKGIPFLSVESLTKNNFDKTKYISQQVYNEEIKRVKIEKSDLLMTRIGDIGTVKYVDWDFESSFYVSLALIKNIANNDFKFLKFQLESAFFKKELDKRTIHVAFPIKINLGEIGYCLVPLPPLPEQEKIADILNVWDNGITKIKAIITELKQRKNGLAMELLSGRLRLSEKKQNSKLVNNKGFTIPNDWKVASLSKVVKQVKNSVTPEDDKLYKQIGIRSHAKGIFYKEEVTGLSLGNKSVFQIEPDCFIVNIVFAWEHAIAKTTTNEVGMIASHRFPMYKPVKDELDLDYLLHFFKSKKGKELLGLASPGGAGRNKTLGQSEFLKLQIPIPDITEQRRIAEMLDKVDAEILLYQEKLAAFQLQKKGLMQQLLTGKVRVKTNE